MMSGKPLRKYGRHVMRYYVQMAKKNDTAYSTRHSLDNVKDLDDLDKEWIGDDSWELSGLQEYVLHEDWDVWLEWFPDE